MDLVDGVNEWVVNWTDRIIDSDQYQRQSINNSRRDPAAAKQFLGWLRGWEDLRRLIQFPDMDQEVLVAFILRYLWQSIFLTILCDIAPDEVNTISLLEDSMENHTTPKPGKIRGF